MWLDFVGELTLNNYVLKHKVVPLRNSRIEVYYLLSMKSLKTYVVKVHDWMHIWFGSLMSIMCTYLLQHVNKTQVKIQSNVTMVIIVYMICMWLWASSCTSNFHYSHLTNCYTNYCIYCHMVFYATLPPMVLY